MVWEMIKAMHLTDKYQNTDYTKNSCKSIRKDKQPNKNWARCRSR